MSVVYLVIVFGIIPFLLTNPFLLFPNNTTKVKKYENLLIKCVTKYLTLFFKGLDLVKIFNNFVGVDNY